MPKPDIHSFIVKVWLEETVEEEGWAKWRGHITHVASGERRYLEKLSEITDFIAPYLKSRGVRFGIIRSFRLLFRKYVNGIFKKGSRPS